MTPSPTPTDTPTPTATAIAIPTSTPIDCSSARIDLPKDGQTVMSPFTVTWTLPTCFMVLQAYQDEEVVFQDGEDNGGIPSGTEIMVEPGLTEIKIWVPGSSIETDSIWVNIVLYVSENLAGHSVAAECNPGAVSSCGCSPQDVQLASLPGYGEVTSNVNKKHTFVNAIGYKKFTEELPNGSPIVLGIYKYSGQVRLIRIPSKDNTQQENAEAIHLMIQLWDGRNELSPE